MYVIKNGFWEKVYVFGSIKKNTVLFAAIGLLVLVNSCKAAKSKL